MKSSEGFVRMRTLQGVVLFIFLLIAGRLAYIQLVDSKYNELAKANVLRHVVQYPPVSYTHLTLPTKLEV